MGLSYLPHTDADRAAMLEAIGAKTVAELFGDVPKELQLGRALELPAALDEASLLKHLRALAGKNANFTEYTCFLGAGAYDHFVPSVIGAITSRSEFLTAYTQYQPEVAQGYLQALWEYQSMIASLTGMAVANASLYDGATAIAEGMMMASAHTKRKEIIASGVLHPHYRNVLHTYAIDLGIEIKDTAQKDGLTDLDSLKTLLCKDTAAVIVQYPNFLGNIEDVRKIADMAHEAGALCIVSADPISLALLEAPGNMGADMVSGEGQALGLAASFGGPGVGFFATTEKLMRKMPGRIVGQTTDSEGKRGFVLTLQAREQHIRREKATSNICSNQALCALSAAIYMAATGKKGLRKIAETTLQKAHYACEKITALLGFGKAFNAPFFKEFVIKTPKSVKEINDRLLQDKIIGGLDLGKYDDRLKNHMLICVTENRSKEEIDLLVERLGAM